MNKLKCIIIEDELKSQATLTNMLKKLCHEVELLNIFDSVTNALPFIKDNEIHLVFLDIELPGESGFILFDYYPEPPFSVIFTTAYNQYAIQAFKFSAIDYLLKPIDIEDLTDAIQRIKKKKINHKVEDVYKILIENLHNNLQRVAIAHQNGYDLIDINEIIWLEANVNYTIIHLKSNSKITVAKTLKMFEEFLDRNMFFRASRSAIVNIKYIVKFQKQNGLTLCLIDNSIIPLSETKKEEFLSFYKKI